MPHVFRHYDQAALDAQYNNRALVPDFADHTAHWARESESARQRLPCRLDLPYGPSALERLDFFPSTRKSAPLHVFIHGGYWRALDKSSFAHLAPAFVDAGVNYAALNYPLAPAMRLDAIVECVRRAILWLSDHAEDLDFDPRRISISGHSAGGHLVAMIAATDWPTFSDAAVGRAPIVTFGASFSGIYDLEPIRLSYLNADLRLDRDEASRNSPIGMSPKLLPPLVLAVGALESQEFLRQQRDLSDAWRRQGHVVETHELKDHNHFSIVQEIGRADGPVHRFLIRRIMGQ